MKKRIPRFSSLLYQTTSLSIKLPVNMPFTIKKRNQNKKKGNVKEAIVCDLSKYASAKATAVVSEI
ncbi:MAG: hypothetical protein IPF54_19030 [Draconibacterium sp.]|nr:hypothetical protein [Draconibacterium sp.]